MVNDKALEKLSYGLYLISTRWEGRSAGCIVNTLTQATASPARVTVTINKENETTRLLQQSGVFTATVLSQEASLGLIGRFGFRSSRDFDKFAGWRTAVGKNGVPYVDEQMVARFECRVVGQMDADTHIVFLAELLEGELIGDGEPMSYAYYHQVKKGRTPPQAPSYIRQQESDSSC
ncbi:MAG: flavin reductase [Oscillospiraceae bacterium]|nr:MAG: flavin reductase [Oscillospiraceae bacterium]